MDGSEGKALDPWQVKALTHGCRRATEALLAEPVVAVLDAWLAAEGAPPVPGPRGRGSRHRGRARGRRVRVDAAELDSADQSMLFGESLPAGLRLVA